MSPSVTADVLEDVAELLTGGPGASAKNPKATTQDPKTLRRDDASPAGQLRKTQAARGPYESTAADINGDGIPDELETRSGLNIQAGNLNGTGDEDGDGINNLDEYRQGSSIETPTPRAATPAKKPDILQRPVIPAMPEHPEPSAGIKPKEEDLTEG